MSCSHRLLTIALTLAALVPAVAAGQDLTEERGRDRRGNDYTSFRTRALRACKDACRDDRRCRAYTFDTRNGSCFLKDRVNTAQRDSGMVTGVKQGYDDDGGYGGGGGRLTEERGYDRRGNDYTSFRTRALRACKDACRDDRRCRAYTFDTRNGSCFLKDRVNTAQRDSGMVTGVKRGYEDDDGYGGSDGRLTEERGYDRRGNDYTSFRARGLGDCKDACRDDRRCQAYTYDTSDRSCYLKSRVSSPRRDPDMVTGVKRGDDDDYDNGHGGGSVRLTEEEGYDRRGNDYRSFRARGLADCKDTCRGDRRCRAYTFDTRNGACFLKDRINSKRSDPGMVTGYKEE